MIKPSLFEVESERDGSHAQIAVAGELDLATSPQLDQKIGETLLDSVNQLTIDLSRLTFVDSSGLRLLIALHDRAREEGWRLSLVAPSEPARAIFQVSGADGHLPFVDGDGSGR
jgi:anti-anti-sigma factor